MRLYGQATSQSAPYHAWRRVLYLLYHHHRRTFALLFISCLYLFVVVQCLFISHRLLLHFIHTVFRLFLQKFSPFVSLLSSPFFCADAERRRLVFAWCSVSRFFNSLRVAARFCILFINWFYIIWPLSQLNSGLLYKVIGQIIHRLSE